VARRQRVRDPVGDDRPAPNLSDIFGQEIGHEVTEIDGVDNLSAIEIDPDVAAEEYRQETIEPMRELLGDERFKTVEEQLNSLCRGR